VIWKTSLLYITLSCITLSVTIGYLLWSRQHVNRYANRLLALLLFVSAYIQFVTSLITNETILDVPHFFRTAAPLNYIVGPLIYLYVRASLLSSSRFDYRFGWLFMPALLNAIELMPFYVLSTGEKVRHIQPILSAPNSFVNITEGWLPGAVHLIGYTLSTLLYTLLAGWLLWIHLRQKGISLYNNSVYLKWIKTFVLIHLIFNLAWACIILFLQHTPYANLSLSLLRIIGQLIICVYIIQRPTLLYGAYWLEKRSGETGKPVEIPPESASYMLPAFDEQVVRPVEEIKPIDNTRKLILDNEPEIKEKLALLEKYMTSQQPYLQPRLSIANVSVATNIPPYLLSSLLNRVLGLDFRDYINAYRVQHLCLLLDSHQYNHLTLEGISLQAGFSSKTTFYRAFQKHTGLTPAQYCSLNSQANT
jgi:AraC-like DNA-binding protein